MEEYSRLCFVCKQDSDAYMEPEKKLGSLYTSNDEYELTDDPCDRCDSSTSFKRLR